MLIEYPGQRRQIIATNHVPQRRFRQRTDLALSIMSSKSVFLINDNIICTDAKIYADWFKGMQNIQG